MACNQSQLVPIPTLTNTDVTLSPSEVAELPTATEENVSNTSFPPGLVFLQSCLNGCGKNLWIINSSGIPTKIPFDGENLTFSPDHRFVAFQKDLDIWILDVSNGDKNRITNTPDCWERNPSWSPDGKRIVFFGCGNHQLDDIYLFDMETEKIKNITDTPSLQEGCIYDYPAECVTEWWEPNSLVLGSNTVGEYQNRPLPAQCHTENGECSFYPTIIFVKDGSYQVVDQNSGIISPPSVSPNGQYLAYDGGHLYDLNAKIKSTLIPSNYGTSPLLASISVHDDGPELIHPVWSPDGQELAWISHIGKIGDIGVIVFDLETQTAKIFHTYTPGGYSGGLPAWSRWPDIVMVWSPDGKWLAFETTESVKGSSDLQINTYIYNRNGEQFAKWNLGGSRLIWSPDSRWMIINDFDSKSATRSLMMVQIRNLQLQTIDIEGDLEIIDWLSE